MNFTTLPSPWLQIINQIFDMEKKLEKMDNTRSIERNIRRIKSQLEEMNIEYLNPIGQRYNETRTDVTATISGRSSNNLIITEVIKPIIVQKVGNMHQIIQTGVVIVESV
ncbi:MAG: hypothetical protein AB8G11_00645 [Saprospiraceae bacterium]